MRHVAGIAQAAPARGQQHGDEEGATAGSHQRCGLGQFVGRQNAFELFAQRVELTAAPGARKDQPLRGCAVARIEADHARQPCMCRRLVLRGTIGARVLVMGRVQFAAEAIHIGGGRKEFIHHVQSAVAPGDALRQRTQRRAHHPLVNQFVVFEALCVAAAGAEHPEKYCKYQQPASYQTS